MRTLIYVGDAPGQSGAIRIDGELYCRGNEYKVGLKLARRLLILGGFIEKPMPELELGEEIQGE